MRRPFNGTVYITQEYNKGVHNGVDYAMPIGTPILAPEFGTITVGDGRASADGRGYFVKVQGKSTMHNLYHLSSYVVKNDYQVSEGQVVGYSGNTGRSTGPHLHWECWTAPYLSRNDSVAPSSVLFGSSSPTPTSGSTLHLPPVERWRVYPTFANPVVGNEVGFLRPGAFGGLSYAVVRRINANVVVIRTRDFGEVQIWVAPNTGATFS